MRHIYRDVDQFVATDGHRLHIVFAEKIEAPYHCGVTEKGLTYPNYRKVLESVEGVKPAYEFKILKALVSMEEMRKLWALVRCVDCSQVMFPTIHGNNVRFVGGRYAYLECAYSLPITDVSINPDVKQESEAPGINLKYFIEACLLNVGKERCKVEFFAEKGMWKVSHDDGCAYVMGMRRV